MVINGNHYYDGCCFDYGYAETNNDDDGKATMEASYFGNISDKSRGSGEYGRWIMADVEQ